MPSSAEPEVPRSRASPNHGGRHVLGLRVSLYASLAMGLATLGGCAFSRGDLGAPLNEASLSAIKKGQSTEDEVVRLLGAPDKIIELGKREAFHYYHYGLKHATVLVFSRVNIAADELYVFFNQQGVVDDVLFSKRTNQLEFQFWPFGE